MMVSIRQNGKRACRHTMTAFAHIRMRFCALLAALIMAFGSYFWASLVVAGPAASRPAGKTYDAALIDNAKQMADVARKAYDAFEVEYRQGTKLVSDLHYWSLRWMRADIEANCGKPAEQMKARGSHLERMKEQRDIVKKVESGLPSSRFEVDYYVLEAERIVLEARKAASNSGKEIKQRGKAENYREKKGEKNLSEGKGEIAIEPAR